MIFPKFIVPLFFHSTKITLNNNSQLLKTEYSTLRLDKNIAASIDMIWLDDLGLSQEDKSLIKSVLYYICVERQTNLFGYGTLDPAHFAQVMEYTEGYLRKPHSNPLQLRSLTDDEKKRRRQIELENPEKKVMDSLLENALYVLHTQTLQLWHGAKEVIIEESGEAAKYTTLSKAYIYLTELEVTTIKRRGEPKITFRYKVDPKFTNNLSLYFLRFSKDAVIALRRSGIDDLYLYLKDLKDTFFLKKQSNKEYDRGQSFDFLCNKAQIPFIKKNGDPKENREIKRELNNVLKAINEKTDLKFSLKWKKKQTKSRWNYEPHFFFNDVESFDSNNFVQNIRVRQKRKDEKSIIFKENLLHELLDTYRRHNDVSVIEEGIENLFYLWIVSNRNKNEKALAFQNAQYLTFGSLHKDIEELTKNWILSLDSLQDLNDIIKQWEQYSDKEERNREKFKNVLSPKN